MDYKKKSLYDPDVKNILLQMGWHYTKKEEKVIPAHYLAYVEQYLNTYNNTFI